MLVKLYIADNEILNRNGRIEIKEYECEREVIDVDERGNKLYEYVYKDEKGIERRVCRYSDTEIGYCTEGKVSEDRSALSRNLEDIIEFDNMEKYFWDSFKININDDDYGL